MDIEVELKKKFFHILIEVNFYISKKKNTLYEFDNDKDELINNLIIPYINGEDFLVDGYTLNKEKILRVKIFTSNYSTEDAVKIKIDEAKRANVLYYYTREVVLNCEDLFSDITIELLKKYTKQKENMNFGNPSNISSVIMNKVFIVHGHDEAEKQKVARFIENLGLEAIILSEQNNHGMTIIEKIEDYSDVGFAIVLYTPCDMGRAKDEDKEKPRARQNVVFEHGYFIGKLGRERVCALKKDDTETPGDISGIVYIPLDENDGWKYKLAKEMSNVGYAIDFNRIFNS